MPFPLTPDGHREGAHSLRQRGLYFAFATLVAAGLYWTALKSLVTFSLHSDIYFYSAVIPLLCLVLIYLQRTRIFSQARYDLGSGVALVLLGLVIRWGGTRYWGGSDSLERLAVGILSLIVLWLGLLIICYGSKVFRAAAFPLSLIFLMVPMPPLLMQKATFVLQECSTQAAGAIFRLGGVPFFRDGFRFSLPGIDIEVAEQCSGIRKPSRKNGTPPKRK